MRPSLRTLVTAAALCGSLVVPAVASAATPHSNALAGRTGTALKAPRAARHEPAPSRHKRGHLRARASQFYDGVGNYCYGRTVSQGGGGSIGLSVASHASFGFPYGTVIRWRPWVYWSNSSGAGWFTNQGWRSYTVNANGNTSSGQGTYVNAQGQVVVVIGGTSVPGTSTYADPIGIAPRTSAVGALELSINGRSYLDYVTPDHYASPARVSGDWCTFA
jgi:hypothetical protein